MQREMGSSAGGSAVTFWGEDSGPNLIVLTIAQVKTIELYAFNE